MEDLKLLLEQSLKLKSIEEVLISNKIQQKESYSKIVADFISENYRNTNDLCMILDKICVIYKVNNMEHSYLIDTIIDRNEPYAPILLEYMLLNCVSNEGKINRKYYSYLVKYKELLLKYKNEITIVAYSSNSFENDKINAYDLRYNEVFGTDFSPSNEKKQQVKLENKTKSIIDRLFVPAIFNKLDNRNYIYLSRYIRYLDKYPMESNAFSLIMTAFINLYYDFDSEIAFIILKNMVENLKKFPRNYNDNFFKTVLTCTNEKELTRLANFIEDNFDVRYLKDGYKKIVNKLLNKSMEVNI